MRTRRNVPFEPLERLIVAGRPLHVADCYRCRSLADPPHERGCVMVADIAAACGTNVRTIYRWRRAGLNPSVVDIDRLCTRLGLHVTIVWDAGEHWKLGRWIDPPAVDHDLADRDVTGWLAS